jgi:hypothetical protein
MATVTQERNAGGLSFWQKMALGLGLFIVLGFAQFAARGFVDIPRVPIWIHLHGAVMLAWLTLGFIQPGLALGGNLALHRRLGWLGVALALTVTALGSFAGIMALATRHVPPFFTPPYFLALTQIGIAVFAAMVLAAVLKRRDTRWHQRLMLGSTILILEPALGRVLPMPLIMPWGEWLVMLFQLGAVWLIARHDRASLGAVHPATKAVAAVIVLTHVAVETAARTALFAGWAEAIAAG